MVMNLFKEDFVIFFWMKIFYWFQQLFFFVDKKMEWNYFTEWYKIGFESLTRNKRENYDKCSRTIMTEL